MSFVSPLTVFLISLGFMLYSRSVLEEFRRSQPRKKHLRIYFEPQETRPFQSMLLGEQELYRPDLGKYFSTS